MNFACLATFKKYLYSCILLCVVGWFTPISTFATGCCSTIQIDYSGNVIPDFYYLSIIHRNHLDVQSDVPLDVTSGAGGCNFTGGCALESGLKEVAPGQWAMVAGDVHADQQVKYNGSDNDKNAVLGAVGLLTPNNVLVGYYNADVNMDGFVKYNGANYDKNVILGVVGLLTPNNVIQGQLYE